MKTFIYMTNKLMILRHTQFEIMMKRFGHETLKCNEPHEPDGRVWCVRGCGWSMLLQFWCKLTSRNYSIGGIELNHSYVQTNTNIATHTYTHIHTYGRNAICYCGCSHFSIELCKLTHSSDAMKVNM